MSSGNVLILTTTSGFLKKFELENVKLLQQLGYTVHYAANRNEQYYLFREQDVLDRGVTMHHIDIARSPLQAKENQKAFQQLSALVKQENILAVHCHTPMGGVLGRMLGKEFPSMPIVYTAHGFHFYRGAPLKNNTVYYAVERYYARYTDIMILINQEDYRHAKTLPLKKGASLYQIPGAGLDLTRFAPLTDGQRREVRQKLGIPEDCFFLVSVGELNENKNHKVAIEALAMLKRHHRIDANSVHYLICGIGKLEQELRAMIRENDLEEIVTLYGYCMEVQNILGSADASVFSSRREGLGMAALESLAMGVPVLASDNRGTREYMKMGKNGYIFPWDAPGELAVAMEILRRRNPEEQSRMRQQCIASAQPFSMEATRAVMQQVYADLDRRIREVAQ